MDAFLCEGFFDGGSTMGGLKLKMAGMIVSWGIIYCLLIQSNLAHFCPWNSKSWVVN